MSTAINTVLLLKDDEQASESSQEIHTALLRTIALQVELGERMNDLK
jgi:hypothetical protein